MYRETLLRRREMQHGARDASRFQPPTNARLPILTALTTLPSFFQLASILASDHALRPEVSRQNLDDILRSNVSICFATVKVKRTTVKAYRDEQIRYQLLILRPCLSILNLTPLNIPVRTMDNHSRKKAWIEPREGTIKPRNQSPRQRKVKIARIMNLACVSIPSIYQDRISGFGLDSARIRYCLPRELGKCLARDETTAFLGAESVLLGVGGVPDPVHEEV
jgi:hypothetical protein